jgi:hypothetical protein
MALFLITSVCDEGMSATRFRVVEAESRLAVATDMLADPVKWEWALRPTELWWDLTYYPYKSLPVRSDSSVAEVAVAAPPPWAVVVGAAERAAEAVRPTVATDPRASLRSEPVT